MKNGENLINNYRTSIMTDPICLNKNIFINKTIM